MPLPLDDLNARLWAWTEQSYHRSPHAGLAGLTPLQRYQQDLSRVRSLGPLAAQLDTIFQHRPSAWCKNGTVSYEGRFYEVPYELTGKTASLLIDPHAHTPIGVEDEAGTFLGATTLLDALADRHRQRHKPHTQPVDLLAAHAAATAGTTLLDLAYAQHYDPIGHQLSTDPTAEKK